MRLLTLTIALLMAAPALAQELPQGPKAGPPQPLPDPECDTSLPNNGEWLVGRWVAPLSKWEFTRNGKDLAFRFEQKPGHNAEYGWRDGAVITGTVTKLSGCTVEMGAREGDASFTFEGVQIDGGRIFGYAISTDGKHVRYTLRRER
ncbi:MAG: hypothetical protein ACM31L_10980 [Actinomycetota bacterium]